ncbi:MAG: MFS transporter [Chloroflexota bacterium]
MRLRLPNHIGIFLPLLDLLHFSHELSWGGLVALLPLLRDDFGLTYSTSGLLVSAYSLTYGVAQMPMGRLADRIGCRLLIVLGTSGCALSIMAVGFSNSYFLIMALLVIAGFLGGAYHPAANVLISGRFVEGQRGRAVGIHLIGGTSALLSAPVLAGLFGEVIGWRAAFVILAIPAPIASVLFWTLVRQEGTREPRGAGKTQHSLNLAQIIKLVGAAVAATALIRIVSTGVASFLPLFLVDKRSVSPFLAAAMLGLFRGSGLIGAPLGGFLCDRIGRPPLILMALIAAGPLLFLLAFLPFSFAFVLALFAFGASIAVMPPTVQSLIMDRIPRGQIGLVIGIYFFLGSELSGLVTPLLGYLIDTIGLESSYGLLAILAAFAAVVFLIARGKIGLGPAR